MKIFWVNDSLCLKVENDAERNALQLVHTVHTELQTTEVKTEQAPGFCPGLNPAEATRMNVAREARLIGISLTRMQALLSAPNPMLSGSR
jgi:hypothetical protein